MGKRDENTTGAVAAERLRAVRKAQGLSLREVAERVADLGHPLILSAIGKIENGTRRMDVDDLTALSVALGVTPATLLLPDADDSETVLQITGVSGSAISMWRWIASGAEAPGGPGDHVGFMHRALPTWMRQIIDRRLRREADPEWEAAMDETSTSILRAFGERGKEEN